MNKLLTQLILLLAVIMMPLTMQAQNWPCLDGIEDMEFETPDEFIAYIEANCDSAAVNDILGDIDFGDMGGDDYDYPPCLDGIDDMDFATEDEFFAYVYANCDSLLIDSLFGNWGDGWNGDWSEEDELAWWTDAYSECIGDQTFDNLDSLFEYLDENDCYGDDSWGGEWTEEDEMAWLADVYAECIGDQVFTDLEAMHQYLEDNDCYEYSDWDCGEFEWSEEDEMALLADEFAECLGDQTFADLEEMYTYIFDNCEDGNDNGTVVVDIEGNIDAACLAGLEQGFTTFQEMILFFDSTCGDVFAIELPDCFLTAPIFDNDNDFFQYLEDNCSDVFEDDGEGGQLMSDEDMGSLIAQYNLAGANAAANNDEQGALGIEAINGLNMSMFPNPATDFVQLNITEDLIQDVQLFDIKGSSVSLLTNLNNASVTIDLEELNVGTYYVRVSTENGKTFSNTIIVR